MHIIALDPIITMSTVGGGGDCVWLVAADQYHNNWDTLKGAANNKLFCPCHSRVRPERRPPTLINSGSFVLLSQRQSSSWSSTSVQSSHQQSYIVLVRETRGLSNNYRPRTPYGTLFEDFAQSGGIKGDWNDQVKLFTSLVIVPKITSQGSDKKGPTFNQKIF